VVPPSALVSVEMKEFCASITLLYPAHARPLSSDGTLQRRQRQVSEFKEFEMTAISIYFNKTSETKTKKMHFTSLKYCKIVTYHHHLISLATI
jgi:uncharacterized protein (DUF1684 family)